VPSLSHLKLDPPQRRQRMLDALKWVLLRESQEQPLLLVFEGLHWIDSETQALLHSLIESLPFASCYWSTIVPSTSTAGAARPIIRNCGWTRSRPWAPTSYCTLCSGTTSD
jgi:predicted ATPase